MGLTLLGVAAGMYLRLRMVVLDRSLWLDPAMLVWNVVERGYLGLLAQLGENQVAPVGFLWLLKSAGRLFDYSEASLVFFPFVAGVAALVLFAYLATKILGDQGAPFAVWPLAVSSTAVYYSGEIKQYSFDLLASTVLLALAWRAAKSRLASRPVCHLALAAVVSVYFSHPALLVAAGLFGVLGLEAWRLGEPAPRRVLLGFGAAVAAHHSLLYVLQMRPTASRDLFEVHAPFFLPLPPWEHGRWYFDTLRGYFDYPLGFAAAPLLPILGLLLGLLVVREAWLEGALLLAPALVLAASAALHFYPLATGLHDVHSRFVLFTLPPVCLLIGRGMSSLIHPHRPGAALVLLAVFVAPQAAHSFGNANYLREEMRPLVADLRDELRPGDTVYVYFAAIPAFRFYTRSHPLPYLAGKPIANPEAEIAMECARLPSGRVHVVLAHFFQGEDRLFRGALDHWGKQLSERYYPGAVLWSYESRGLSK